MVNRLKGRSAAGVTLDFTGRYADDLLVLL